MAKCRVCELPLVRQLVSRRTNLPLSEEEVLEYRDKEQSSRRTIACDVCGVICYSSEVGVETVDVCQPCGGRYTITKPDDVLDLKICAFYRDESILMWSCPTHGGM